MNGHIHGEYLIIKNLMKTKVLLDKDKNVKEEKKYEKSLKNTIYYTLLLSFCF